MGIERIIAYATTPTNVLWSAVVSALVAAIVSYLLKRKESRDKAQLDYEYEQRRKQRELNGLYHGRIVNSANSLMQRQWNLYKNSENNWLRSTGCYADDGYYLLSTCHRFLSVLCLLRQLEKKAILLDNRTTERREYTFLNFITMMQWVMTDVALFEGIKYDPSIPRDHFFSDSLRQQSDHFVLNDDPMSFEQFSSSLSNSNNLFPTLDFFNGLSSGEGRLRWDRFVALHLILMAFINSFGYRRQYSSQDQFLEVANKIENKKVLLNLLNWLGRHDLGSDKEIKKLKKACAVISRRI